MRILNCTSIIVEVGPYQWNVGIGLSFLACAVQVSLKIKPSAYYGLLGDTANVGSPTQVCVYVYTKILGGWFCRESYTNQYLFVKTWDLVTCRTLHFYLRTIVQKFIYQHDVMCWLQKPKLLELIKNMQTINWRRINIMIIWEHKMHPKWENRRLSLITSVYVYSKWPELFLV